MYSETLVQNMTKKEMKFTFTTDISVSFYFCFTGGTLCNRCTLNKCKYYGICAILLHYSITREICVRYGTEIPRYCNEMCGLTLCHPSISTVACSCYQFSVWFIQHHLKVESRRANNISFVCVCVCNVPICAWGKNDPIPFDRPEN